MAKIISHLYRWNHFYNNLFHNCIFYLSFFSSSGKKYFFEAIYAVLMNLLYYGVFESSKLSATPGRAIVGLAIVSETGEILTFKQATIRYFSKFLSAIILSLGYLMQPFTKKRQTLHDIIAKTIVIKRAPPEIKYTKAWKDQFNALLNKI